jgi:hypothetical protein
MGNKYLLAALLAAASFSTQATAETNYKFDSLSKIKHTSSNLSVTGVIDGDSTSSTVTFPGVAWERCSEFLNLMVTSPGTYFVTLTTDTLYTNPPFGDPVPYLAFTGCTLDLKP